MRRLFVILLSAFFFGSGAYAEKYIGDGDWIVIEWSKGIILVVAVDIYRERPDKGARPTFMVNYYDDEGGCNVSLGLSMLVEDIPKQVNKKEALGMLSSVMETIIFMADDEILSRTNGGVQALDMGGIVYARKLIDSDTLAAFMTADIGTIRAKNKDAVIKFSMRGFENTINHIVDTHCR